MIYIGRRLTKKWLKGETTLIIVFFFRIFQKSHQNKKASTVTHIFVKKYLCKNMFFVVPVTFSYSWPHILNAWFQALMSPYVCVSFSQVVANIWQCIIQLMAQFRIFPSSESRHSFVANYTSAVKFKIHILVLFCCIIIPLYVSESKYL